MTSRRSALILLALVETATACSGHADTRSGAPAPRTPVDGPKLFAPRPALQPAPRATVKTTATPARRPPTPVVVKPKPKSLRVRRAPSAPAPSPPPQPAPSARSKPTPAPHARPAHAAAPPPAEAPHAEQLSVSTDAPFAGDGPLLATVSPNGDGYRDDASVRFYLTADADVTVAARATARPLQPVRQPEWSVQQPMERGWHTVTWTPSRKLEPTTYVICLSIADNGHTQEYGRTTRDSTAAHGPVVRVLGAEAAFERSSYAPGQTAALTVADDSDGLTVRVVDVAASGVQPAMERLDAPDVLPPQRYGWDANRDGDATIPIPVGDWRPGVYFAVIRDDDGRVAYAPLIVKASQPTGRVAVVISDHTWFAYDFHDDDHDGFADSWYAGGPDVVELNRPFTHAGLPWGFGQQVWPFLRWLRLHGVRADFLSENDLAAAGSSLARSYDLIAVPTHLEYVTAAEYDALEHYRNQGGDLIFLCSNDIYWSVTVSGTSMRRVARWRDLGRPEAELVGAQYAGSKDGDQGPYVVAATAASRWAFAGTGLAGGDRFGSAGTEFDVRTPASPHATQLLASVRTGRHRGEMTYYELAGAKVFAPGTFFSGGVLDAPQSRLLENVWNRSDAPDLTG